MSNDSIYMPTTSGNTRDTTVCIPDSPAHIARNMAYRPVTPARVSTTAVFIACTSAYIPGAPAYKPSTSKFVNGKLVCPVY